MDQAPQLCAEGQRGVRHLHDALVGHAQCEHCETWIVAELQLGIGDLHVILRLREQPGVASAGRDALQCGDGVLQAGHPPGERIELSDTIFEITLQRFDLGACGLVVVRKAGEIFVQVRE